MSKSVEETRRELFEQHMSIPDSVTWSDETNSYIGQNFWLVDYAWEAFNAALDCVEIELPRLRAYPPNEASSDVDYWIDEAKWETLSKCRGAITATNLGLKIK
jgi:hypothetical protein